MDITSTRPAREIVVGVDASQASRRALDRALWETQDLDRPLQVLHTWTMPTPSSGFGGVGFIPLSSSEECATDATTLVNDLLGKALARCGSQRTLEVRATAVQDDPGRALARAAKEAALVIVGGRGRGYTKSALLGSTTSYVLHHAAGPVMIVPEDGPPAGRFGKVVVGVDGSSSSHAALRWGLDAARREGCPLVAVHVVDFPSIPGDLPLHFAALAAYDSDAHERLSEEVDSAIPDRFGVDVTLTIAHSPAAAALMDAATPDDLLVTGSRGRGGFASLVLGSVATQLSQHASSVVVVVKADQDRLSS